MDINDNIESPFVLKVSFNKLLNQYEELIKTDNDFIASNARRVLKIAEENPILREGFSDFSVFSVHSVTKDQNGGPGRSIFIYIFSSTTLTNLYTSRQMLLYL